MPELPEVEHLRRTLEPCLVGCKIAGAVAYRLELILDRHGQPINRRHTSRALLVGTHLAGILRHGKQLALLGEDGRALCIGLGMTGQMWYIPAHRRLPHQDHVHVIWRIADESPASTGRLAFRDIRRFGRIRCFDSLRELHESHWGGFGPDALTISTSQLVSRLKTTSSPIKAALLNQRLIAGIGNIYADEALFLAGINPLRPAREIPQQDVLRLQRAIHRVLNNAIRAGGTTFRDYVDAHGRPGRNSCHLNVYGRQSDPCYGCGSPLQSVRVQQRTTVFCPICQRT